MSVHPIVAQLAAARKRARLSKVTLAEQAGITEAGVRSIESGRSASPGLQHVAAIAKALGYRITLERTSEPS